MCSVTTASVTGVMFGSSGPQSTDGINVNPKTTSMNAKMVGYTKLCVRLCFIIVYAHTVC